MSAGVLVLTMLFRLIAIGKLKSVAGFVLTIYLAVIAAVFVLIELGKFRFRVWFHFLNYGYGKALFSLFLGLLLLGAGAEIVAFDIVAGLYFLLAALIFAAISFAYGESEWEWVKAQMDKLNEENDDRAGQQDVAQPNQL